MVRNFQGKNPSWSRFANSIPGFVEMAWNVRSCSQAWIPEAQPVSGEETAFNGMGESWGDILKTSDWKTSSDVRSLLAQYRSLLQERELPWQDFHLRFVTSLLQPSKQISVPTKLSAVSVLLCSSPATVLQFEILPQGGAHNQE